MNSRLLRCLGLLCLLLACLGGSTGRAADKTNAPAKPLLFAFYHPWYGTPWGPAQQWYKWDSFAFPDRYQPGQVLTNGLRSIAAPDYPLIGPYDNSEREIARWHFRLAKAAGFDGFLCSWWKFPRKNAWGDWQSELFEKVLLPVAQEENFKIAAIDECAHYVRNYDALVERATNHLPRLAAHPAYLRVRGQPVWFIYQVWDDWLTAEQAGSYAAAVEKNMGDVYWMFDKLKAAPAAGGGMEMFVKPEWLQIPQIDCFGTYSYFGHWRDVRPEVLNALFTGFAQNVRQAGKQVQLPVSPGHNNTPVNPEPLVIGHKQGETLRTFLRAVDAARPEVAVVCSFNEWLEGTQVEPSRNWDDPYFALKILAEWRGIKWVQPPLPPLSVVDPAEQKRLGGKF